ncbi:flagellar basal body-associated FliL family protein [Thiorhodospira sibirica]|uniref:flagellar basal body-associated FliL family protein n=1 Tax=Thiorhodospira sibirica TaxID=154347 RepID=UPI00022C4CA5|nr:flagellar basal body-associated FliL family protein [Thiorhodospira sibirica]
MQYSKYLPFLALILALLTALGFSGAVQAAPSKAPAFSNYMTLDPPLVVNIANERRAQFLQIRAELYVETPQDAEVVTHHMPLIRDRLIMFFGGRAADEVGAVDNREVLRQGALDTVRQALSERAGRPGISGLYFTSFIIQ